MDFPKKQQQCLIPRYLLQYLTSLQMNHDDPTAPWGGGGGGSYTAGDGIEISDEDVISIDDTVALKSDIPSLTGYATETWVTNQGYLVQSDLSDYITSSELITELGNYVTSTDLAAELLNYAELDDIPTKTSDLTNDSGFITSSALTGYATETWVTNQGYSTFSGSYNDLTNKPDLSIYELAADAFSGDYNDLINKPTIPVVPTNISAFTNDSGYITSSALTGYATESWVSTELLDYVELSDLATVATSGSYNDLTNKPTIPDAVSGTNDGTNWTSLTIGSDTYGLANGSTPANMVTTDTDQSIGGVKTFLNRSVYLTERNTVSNTSSTNISFYEKDQPVDRWVGSVISRHNNLRFNGDSTRTNIYYMGLADPGYSQPTYIGFYVAGGTLNSKLFAAPHPSYSAGWDSAYPDHVYYIPMVISDGTTNYYANEQGIVTIPAGGSSYTAGTGIDITNDTISIDSTVVALKSDIPTVPTKTSDLTNDSGYITGITSSDVTTALGYTPGTSNFSGDYDDLTNKPSIPNAVSGTNDGTNWTSLTIGSDTYRIPSGGSGSGPTVTRYTGYASHPITYTVSSSASTAHYTFINIFSSELSGFLNYDNVNPGDILYVNITVDYTASNVYYGESKVFTVCVPPKPNSSTGTSTSDTHDVVTNGSYTYSWGCTTRNHMTNQQEATESNIIQKNYTPTGNTIVNVQIPDYPYGGYRITITINSITHIAF